MSEYNLLDCFTILHELIVRFEISCPVLLVPLKVGSEN